MITDVVLSFPLAYYAARLATPRRRNVILVLVVIPLWANYVVRVFAWKLILTPQGFLNWLVHFSGAHLQIGNSNWAIWLTFVYLWLPFTMLPIFGALERVPPSFLEASNDLGAKGWKTFRSVVFPLIVPGIVAGSIFAFSLTLGDYITPQLVGNTLFIGNVIYDERRGRQQRAVRGGIRVGPGGDHGGLPLDREAAGRVRGALGGRVESRIARVLIKTGSVLTMLFLYIPLAIVVVYAFNNSIGQKWPIQSLHVAVVRGGLAQPRRPDGSRQLREGRDRGDDLRVAAGERRSRSPFIDTGSSGATPCRSCW